MTDRRRGNNGHGDQLPESWLSGWFDPELEELFSAEPELKQTAMLLHAARPEIEPDPRFRNRLRASLMADAHRMRAPRRRLFLGPVHLAWAGAGVGVVAIAATVLTLLNGPPPDRQNVVALSNVAAQHSVSPDDVITVAFNQPMDQRAVVSGLHIQPATEIRTAWRGNDLLITPVHHLTGNTPYTVTIARAAARTAAGATAAAPIEIAFGTAATPPRTTAAKPPALVTTAVGQALPGASVLIAPDGSFLVTSAAAPSPSASAAPTASATSAAATPTAEVPGPALVAYPAGGGAPIVVGRAATRVAFSPNGNLLAAAEPDGSGADLLVVSGPTGSAPATLVSSQSSISSLAWSSNRTVVYATAGAIRSVDLTGVSHTLAQPAGAGSVQLARGGRYAYLAPVSGSGGQLLDIASGATQPLPGSGPAVAFSDDGSTVAWEAPSGSPGRVETQVMGSSARVPVSTVDTSARVTILGLSPNGSEIAYVQQRPGGAASLVVAQLPSGAPLAIGPAASTLAFGPGGRTLALLTPGSAVLRGTVPGGTQPTQSTSLPAAARTALQAFVDAQVRGDTDTIGALSASSAAASPKTPAGLTRGYVVSAASNRDGTVTATAELIVDPTASHPQPQQAEETLTLSRLDGGAAFLITGVDAGRLHDEQPGPHVVGVTTATQHGAAVVQINFDSDLAAASVANAIALVAADGSPLHPAIVYNAETRSATLTLSAVPASPITVSVAPALQDVDGQSLGAQFTTRAGF